MGTYFFHEQTLPDAQDGSRDLVRYYYDDISDEILTWSFRLIPKTVRKEFFGDHLMPRLTSGRRKIKIKRLSLPAHADRAEARLMNLVLLAIVGVPILWLLALYYLLSWLDCDKKALTNPEVIQLVAYMINSARP